MDSKKIIEYISIAQPELEKYASQQSNFESAVRAKMNSLVKEGCYTEKEAHCIIKEASTNPASILNHLDVKRYQSGLGTPSDTPTFGKTASDGSGFKRDSLYNLSYNYNNGLEI